MSSRGLFFQLTLAFYRVLVYVESTHLRNMGGSKPVQQLHDA
jgi:hypothetical protein